METAITKSDLGIGIYTIPDMAIILKLPQHRIRYWLNEFWNSRLISDKTNIYSWGDGREKATSFYTLIEFFTFSQLRLNKIGASKILKAHKVISSQLKTPYPFASATILTDGKRVFYSPDNMESIIHADDTLQFTIAKIIMEFCKKIDFNSNDLAVRYWPLGKEKSIVVDPHHQFGQPTISGSNILAETLYLLHKGGESNKFISNLYGISIKAVREAVNFYKLSA